jgi:hypothetical protein
MLVAQFFAPKGGKSMGRKNEIDFYRGGARRGKGGSKGRGGGRALIHMQRQTMQMFGQLFGVLLVLVGNQQKQLDRIEGNMQQRQSFVSDNDRPRLGYRGPWLITRVVDGIRSGWMAVKFLGVAALLIVGLGLLHKPPPPPSPPTPVTVLERLEAAEARFDSLSARINTTPRLKPIWIDRARFAAWKHALAKPHTAQLEETVEGELDVFERRLDAHEANYQLFLGRLR